MLPGFKNLESHINDGTIIKRKHPTQDLWILNYSQQCQINKLWDSTTIACRGLIINDVGRIISRPFKKFFNTSELSYFRNHLHNLYDVKYSEIFSMPFMAYEKMDGSLGVSYWDKKGRFGIATRGSFESDQANRAMEIWKSKYDGVENLLDKNLTYLFEIIYKENRIVVDYKGEEDLYLIAIVDTQTAVEKDIYDKSYENLPFPRPNIYHGVSGLESLSHYEEENKEGFVLNFGSGFRAKFKFSQYVLLHRVLSNFTNKKVLEHIINNTFDNMIDLLPDEFYKEAKSLYDNYTNQYNSIKNKILLDFDNIKHIKDRKLFAIEAKKLDNPTCLFSLYDQKDISKQIWDKVKE